MLLNCVPRIYCAKDLLLFLSVQLTPPLLPPSGEVNAADAFDIGNFDEDDTKKIKVIIEHVVHVLESWVFFAFGNLCLS